MCLVFSRLSSTYMEHLRHPCLHLWTWENEDITDFRSREQTYGTSIMAVICTLSFSIFPLSCLLPFQPSFRPFSLSVFHKSHLIIYRSRTVQCPIPPPHAFFPLSIKARKPNSPSPYRSSLAVAIWDGRSGLVTHISKASCGFQHYSKLLTGTRKVISNEM